MSNSYLTITVAPYAPGERNMRWLDLVHQANRVAIDFFGAALFTEITERGYVETYANAEIILSLTDGFTTPDSTATIVATTPYGAKVLAQAAKEADFEVSA